MRGRDTVKRNRFYHCLEYDHDPAGELGLVACGMERCDGGVTYGPDLRECWHLHAVASGTGALYAGGQEYHPGPNQLFLLKHAETVTYTAWAVTSAPCPPRRRRFSPTERSSP